MKQFKKISQSKSGSKHTYANVFRNTQRIEIQGLLRTLKLHFQGTILVRSDSITAIFNVYFCDDGTVLLDKKTKHDNY